jgi:hypothetical protein
MFLFDVEGEALAREQRQDLTAKEIAWLDQQQDFLKMGVHPAPTKQDLALAQSIGNKMNQYRYGKVNAFGEPLQEQRT